MKNLKEISKVSKIDSLLRKEKTEKESVKCQKIYGEKGREFTVTFTQQLHIVITITLPRQSLSNYKKGVDNWGLIWYRYIMDVTGKVINQLWVRNS